MSKTSFNQIAPADLVEEFGVDGYRYHFLRDQPFGPDGEFSYEGMIARYNADLANNLGNLLSRVATVVEKKCGGIGPAPAADSRLSSVASAVYAGLYVKGGSYDLGSLVIGVLFVGVAIGWGLFARARRELVLSLNDRARRVESGRPHCRASGR